MIQRTWQQAQVGDLLGPVAFPLSVYRLVVAAGANRDFNSIHHNTEYARASGAPDMYANTLFLLGMWERVLRNYMGPAGTLRRIAGFRMNSFNCVGDEPVVFGQVIEKFREGSAGMVRIRMWTQIGDRTSVGPGMVSITLPDSD